MNYLPALAIRATPTPSEFPPWLAWVAPLAGVLFLVLCLGVWAVGVRRYASTGS